MDRKTLLKKIGQKLQDIRQPLKYSNREMADRLGAYRSSYFRYESGETAPQIMSLYKLGNTFDISLDWLILDKGPMYYKEKGSEKEKEVIKKPGLQPQPAQETPQPPGIFEKDVQELLDHMERIPLLRYEMLVYFYKFKEDRKEMVESAMKETK